MISTVLDYIAQNPRLFIGNAWGLLAAVLSFCAYQAKNEKRLLILQTGVIIATILSYATLGAWSGMALNIVCLLRNLVFFAKNTKVFSHPAWPYVLAAILAGMGALSWQGPISLLVVAALVINTIVLSWGSNRRLRQSILFTSTLVIIYNLYFQAYFSVLMESVCIVSSAVGLYRYRGQAEKN